MAILNIPYTYPKSRLQRDIDQLGLPYTGFHYPSDRKSKNRCRGFAFVQFATSDAARAFQRLFHHRVLSYPGSLAKNVSVVPSESSTTSGQMHPGSRADYLGWPGSTPGESASYSSESSGSQTEWQMHTGSRADYLGWPGSTPGGSASYSSESSGSQTECWPPQRLAAPPGLHQGWHAPRNQSGGIVDPRAGLVPISVFEEEGTVVLHRFSL